MNADWILFDLKMRERDEYDRAKAKSGGWVGRRVDHDRRLSPALLDCKYRVRYKLSKASRYWKEESVPERIGCLLDEFVNIHRGLEQHIDDMPNHIPHADDVRTLSTLKPFEDAP